MAAQKEVVVDVAQVKSNPGHWMEQTKECTVFVRHQNENEVVMISITEYQRLKRQDRQSFLAQEMSDEKLERLKKNSDLPSDSKEFEKENEEWKS